MFHSNLWSLSYIVYVYLLERFFGDSLLIEFLAIGIPVTVQMTSFLNPLFSDGSHIFLGFTEFMLLIFLFLFYLSKFKWTF